jgi:hypothetical protein
VVDFERLGDNGCHRRARVERFVGILEDDLDLAPQRAPFGALEADQLAAVEADAAGARRLEPGDKVQERGLARAALADQRQHLAGSQVEVDAVERA